MQIFTRYCFILSIFLMFSVSGFATDLQRGDIAILGISTDNSATTGISGQDEISFVCFKDITNGTTIDFTDNGWEKANTNAWGETEGVIRLSRTGGTIGAGTVITFRYSASNGFEVVSPDNLWSLQIIEQGFDLGSAGDQLFALAGGAWINPNGNDNAVYQNGEVLFAVNTKDSWVADGTNNQSNIYPGLVCYQLTNASGTATHMKFTGSLTDATQRDWLVRTKDANNWSFNFNDSQEYQNAGVNFASGLTINKLPGNFTAGIWTGTANRNWFDCDNWQNLSVPDQNVDVVIPATAADGVEIFANAEFADQFGGQAKTASLSIDAHTLKLEHANSVLRVNGNLVIGSAAELDLNDGNPNTSIDGQLYVSGNWINNSVTDVDHGNSSVYLNGNSQLIGGLYGTTFNRLEFVSGSKTLDGINITVMDQLDLNNAHLVLNANTLFIESSDNNAISTDNGHIISETLPGSYSVVDWNIGHNPGAYSIPFGTNEAQPQDLTFTYNILNLGSGHQMERVRFITYPTLNYQNLPLPTGVQHLTNDLGKDSYHKTLDRFWIVDNGLENANFTASPEIEYVFRYNEEDYTSFGNNIDEAKLVARRYNSFDHVWTDWVGSPTNQTTSNTVSLSVGEDNGFYDVWTLGDDSDPLPIELVRFEAACQNGKVKLEWTTASETNNDFFTIERSRNGQTFEEVAIIDGAGNSNQLINYELTDSEPLEGTSFYRLKQTDFDGAYEYSKIVSTLCSNSATNLEINYSNISDNGVIEVSYSSATDDKVRLTIRDITGKTLVSEELQAKAGKNTIQLNAENVSEGIYIINLSNSYRLVSQKVFY